MMNRSSMREQRGLGQAIDARRRERAGELVQADGLGAAGAAPLSSGGSVSGGGGVTTEPALPESFVTGLAGGAGNPALSGELRITGSGAASVTQDEPAGEIDVHAPDYSAGDGLSLVSEEFSVDSSVLRTSGDQSVAGLKTFSTLPQSADAPTVAADLTTKDYVDGRTQVVHRQIFPAAGSRDGVSGNSEINLPWDVSAYPDGTSLPTVTVESECDFAFSNTSTPAVVTNSRIEFHWTASQTGGFITSGAQCSIACHFQNIGSTVSIGARIKLVDTTKFSALYLSVNDEDSNIVPSSSTNMISSIVDNVWITLEIGELSIQNLGDSLTGVLTIQGTTDSLDVGPSEVHVAYLYVVQKE